MRIRAESLPIPPDRAPYFRVTIGEQTVYLRTPSLIVLAELGRLLGSDQLRSVLVVSAAVQGGSSLLESLAAARSGSASALGLLGALVGLAWADPVLELETTRPERWTSETLGSFGAAVFEELHEAGWALGPIVVAALAVVEQVSEIASLRGEVQERIRFFLRPKGTSPGTSPSPSAPSSEAGSGRGAAES